MRMHPPTDTYDRMRGPHPDTAYPLSDYAKYIASVYGANREQSAEVRLPPTFVNGDGKVNPSAYGSLRDYDLGLCYTTFKTRKPCEMGVRCPWRHHPLSTLETRWIVRIGGEKGRDFLDGVNAWYDVPDVPVPGANLFEIMVKDGLDGPPPAIGSRSGYDRPRRSRSPY